MNKLALFLIPVLMLSIVFSVVDFDAYGKTLSKHHSTLFSKQLDYKIQVNKYANYVHFQPEWNSYLRTFCLMSQTFGIELISERNQ